MSKFPRIMIAAPVRNRAWILTRYLDAIIRLDYPKEYISLLWIANDCQDDTFSILQTWERILSPMGYADVAVCSVDTGRTESEYKGKIRLAGPRHRAYPILANLRNIIREVAIAQDVDYLLSVDSDIILHPDTLKRLLNHRVGSVAALIDNGFGTYNYLSYNETKNKFYRERESPSKSIFPVGLTGACCLYSKKSLIEGHFFVGRTGEDEGMALSLKSAGIQMYVDGTLKLEHIMESSVIRQKEDQDVN